MPRISLCAGLVACAVSVVVAPSALAGDPPPVSLRIVTWNVLNGVGPAGSASAIAFGKVITNTDLDGPGPNTGLVPDVVCLQELDQTATSHLTAFRNAYLPGYQIRSANGDGFNYNATLVRPGITVVSSTALSTPGPRDVVKTQIQVEGALRPVWIYNAHFKAFGDPASQAERAQEAAAVGNSVSFDLNFGGGVNVVVCGDLNSNNNTDGTLTGLYATSTNPVVLSGLEHWNNCRVETLNGRNSGSLIVTTHPSSGSRLDYIWPDIELASIFDADMSGTFTQAEINTMGFVYYSNEDAGLRSNGDSNATNAFSDHRPVVFDLLLPRDPMVPYYEPADVSRNGAVDAEDLYLWESAYALGVIPNPNPAPDLDGDRNIDPQDQALLRAAVRGGESSDVFGQP